MAYNGSVEDYHAWKWVLSDNPPLPVNSTPRVPENSEWP